MLQNIPRGLSLSSLLSLLRWVQMVVCMTPSFREPAARRIRHKPRECRSAWTQDTSCRCAPPAPPSHLCPIASAMWSSFAMHDPGNAGAPARQAGEVRHVINRTRTRNLTSGSGGCAAMGRVDGLQQLGFGVHDKCFTWRRTACTGEHLWRISVF
jgi:hypothetical protein